MSATRDGTPSACSKTNADNNDFGANSAPLHSSSEEAHVPFGVDYDKTKEEGGENKLAGNGRMADSFGLPPYVPRYSLEQRYYESVLNVPWYLRKPSARRKPNFFDFLRSRDFWRQTEFALRITLFAVLLPSSLIVAEFPNSPFVSKTYVLAAVLLASRITVGEILGYVVSWIRAGFVWLPLATIGAALHVGNDLTSWCFFYTIFLFVMATLAENMVRRICLLLFNSCMIGLLIEPTHNFLHPSRVMVDWCIGTGLCVFATFVPYPIFSKTRAEQNLAKIAWSTGAAFSGMTSCFWSESNVKRNMAMTKVRMLTTEIDCLLKKFHEEQEHSFYEFLFESWEVRDTRVAKAQLFELLRTNLRGLARVLDIVESKPWVVDDSERSKAFGEMLHPHIQLVSSSLDKLTDVLASAKTFKVILEKRGLFLELNQATQQLQINYNKARRLLFYQNKTESLEEFVPLMTFFIFSIIIFRDSMMRLNYDVHHSRPRWKDSARQVFQKIVLDPLDENVSFFRRLVTEWRRREIQRVIEAAKVSAAMILTVSFSFLMNIDKSSFSGPNIIAFVSSSNPVEAVQASIVRLTGCILGTVLGFFAGTFSNSSVEKIASLCTLIFIGTFLRYDKEYGIMAVYAMFVMIPLNTVTSTTTEDTIARMNQATFGILIYIFISILVLPLSPGLILRKKRINILMKMSEAMKMLCDFFSEPLQAEADRETTILTTKNDIYSQKETSQVGPVLNTSARFDLNIHSNFREDLSLRNIHALLEDIEKRQKATYLFMEFARQERGLVEIDYPSKACEKTSFHFYRMICLLRTMWCSWEVLRCQEQYTPETLHILRTLHPIALDASRSFSRFVDMLCYTLRDPSTALETELMQVVLEFIQTVDELHFRKNQIMIAIIGKSVSIHKKAMHEINLGGGLPLDSGKQHKVDTRMTTIASGSSKLNIPITGQNDDAGSVLPLLRRRAMLNVSDMDSLPAEEAMILSESFLVPVTAEDAEGLHSFTLSFQMFADETKMLLMSLEEILDHLRSKL